MPRIWSIEAMSPKRSEGLTEGTDHKPSIVDVSIVESEFLLPREKFVILGPHDEKKRNRCRYANAHSRAVLLSTNLQRRREDIVKRIHGAKKRVREAVQRENIYTIPNVLCVLRIAATPGLGWLVLTGSYPWALSLFCIAGFTDLLDGYIARHWKGQSSMLGSFLDPLADKFLVATLFVTLTVQGLIPVPLTALIISRDVCLMTAGFIVRYKSLPQPRTLSRYFDGTLATAQLAPTQISKFNTAVQLGLVASTLTAPVLGILPETSNPFFLSLWIFTAATTVVSGASYVSNRDTYRLRPRSQQNPKP
ncbi:unnamed protein product [Cyprideis torosa]|uniref:cardiolipin synthase (CMP-forming) n=1 Tax=Cyprideis torosa TaxID=163714 RepID=A0A7R8WDZ8_9CRUS|nr:unnamed protein product [Cyprideis torosa]CAG0890145.1 unnamed protein product [Cyprideis torosa]